MKINYVPPSIMSVFCVAIAAICMSIAQGTMTILISGMLFGMSIIHITSKRLNASTVYCLSLKELGADRLLVAMLAGIVVVSLHAWWGKGVEWLLILISYYFVIMFENFFLYVSDAIDRALGL